MAAGIIPDYPVQRAQLEQLLAPYLARSEKLSLTFIDPVKEPDRARALGAARHGELQLRMGQRLEVIATPTTTSIDRALNRLALQGDLIGAAALGIPNILCLAGDDIATGDQPEAKPVYDIDSRALMRTARGLRDDGALPSGRAVDPPARLFIGAADAPLDPPADWTPEALLAKYGMTALDIVAAAREAVAAKGGGSK